MRLVSGANKQDAYPGNFLRLLRPCGNAKRKEQSAKGKNGDFLLHVFLYLHPLVPRHLTLTPPHLMTLSARANTFGGIVRPICFAVIKLITNLNFVGCSTGCNKSVKPRPPT